MDLDIDAALGRIGSAPAHPGLDGLERRVMTIVAEQPARAMATRSTIAGAAFALLLGIGSVVYPAPHARAVPATPFGVPSPLAPSTLLLGAR